MDDSPLPGTEVHYLRSANAGTEYKILVGLPGTDDDTPQSVLFMGDAWANFGTAVEIVRLLLMTGDISPVLVVAVGYRVSRLEENFPLRTRDFTPTVDPTMSDLGVDDMGGADRFLAFLRDDLKPWVRERYRADPDDSALFGYSLGGLFATHVLLTEPSVFRRYGIGSPSLYWSDGLMFDQEAAYARTHGDLAVRVHMSVGAYENTDGERHWLAQIPSDRRAIAEAGSATEEPFDSVADVARMVDSLRGRAYPNLELEYEVLPGEYHQTAPPLALSRALRYLFGAPR